MNMLSFFYTHHLNSLNYYFNSLKKDQEKTYYYKKINNKIDLDKIKLNKGENFKINQGAGVISAIGMVGKIEKVSSRSSTVQLLTNQEFRVVAHIKGDARPITYRGAGVSFGRQNLGFIMDIPQDVSIPKDGFLEIVSSSLGGTFPQNLSIGKVFELEPSVDGLFQSAQVLLSSDLNIIKEVTILNSDYE